MALRLLWLRADLRRRARALVILALLVALAAATVVTAFAGARRALSVQDRLARTTLPATVAVLANTPGFDWEKVEHLPHVSALTRFVVDYELTVKGVGNEPLGFPPADDAMMRTIERPVIRRGRIFDPSRADEVVVTPGFVEHYGLDVGDEVEFILPTPEQISEETDESVTLKGPHVRARIVGVGRSPWFADQPGGSGGLQPSPGLAARYPDNVLGDQSDPQNPNYVNALVRLDGGEAAIPEFRKDLARVTGRDDLDVWDLPAQQRDRQRTIRFEALCLVAFGLAALGAACFLVGQAIARYTATAVEELRSARAIGMTPAEIVSAASLAPLLAGIVGAVAAVSLVYLASGRFPLGLAGFAEPSPGRTIDWIVLAPGLFVVLALVVLAGIVSARRSLRIQPRKLTRSATSELLAKRSWPVPMVIGARFALEPGRGRSAVPVRPAMVGAVVGLLGITSALTFGAGVRDAADHPERFGQTFDAGAFLGFNGQDFGPVDDLLSALADQSDVVGVQRSRIAAVSDPSGDSSVSLYTYGDHSKPLDTVLTAGRMPENGSEIVLAPRTVETLHASVGDRVTLAGNKGRHTFEVTGTGFVPSGPHNNYADGAWITDDGYDGIVDGFKFDTLFVATRDGTDLGALNHAIAATDPHLAAFPIGPPDPLPEVTVIRDVEVLPLALGLFLALLAVAAVGHALAMAVRRRSGDLAVLRALGMTPAQCRWVVVTQSTVMGIIGLVFGVPLGVAVGRLAWRAVAGYTPLFYVPPLAGLGLLFTIPAALLIANLLGAWPGQRAARLQVHRVLRTE